jgi:hypothetical protein
MERIETIRKKLHELIVKDTEFKIFCAEKSWNGHEYKLNPCLTISGIKKFEKNLNIELPKEYKEFLTTIANGGAGPCYGLYDLNYGISCQARYFDEKDQKPNIFLAPFPYSNKEVLSKIDDSKTIIDDNIEIFEKKHPTTGLIFLSEYGCGGYYVLVVNGEQYGKVWFYHSDGFLNPCCIKGKQLKFFDWYEYWLKTSLDSLK